MTRNHFLRDIRDAAGNLLTNSGVRLLQAGTTTPVTDTIYNAATGSGTRTNPWTSVDGTVDFYIDNPGIYRIGVTNPLLTSEKFFEDLVISPVPATSGVGSPQGILTAPPGTKYTDGTGTVGAWEWTKTNGTNNTGWKVTNGDTGWRDITALLNAPASAIGAEKVAMRRENSDVYLRVSAKWTSAWTAGGALLTIPSGFRQFIRGDIPAPYAGVIPASMEVDGSFALYSSTASGTYRNSVEWITDDPWPTSLPGNAM